MPTHHGRILADLIDQRIDQIMQWMADGVATDHEMTRQFVGHIQGLREAKKLSEDADMKL